MRVKVIDSNSSFYRNKVTKCSAIIRQKLIPCNLPCNLPKCPGGGGSQRKPVPPTPHSGPPPNAPSPISSLPVLFWAGAETETQQDSVPTSPSLPGTILAVGCLLCWPCEWVTHTEGHCVRSLEFSGLICPCPSPWGGQGRRERKWQKNDYEDLQDKRSQLLW